MKIDDKVLNKLDFPKVLARLAEFCILPRAKELALALKPDVDIEFVRMALQKTEEAKNLMRGNPLFSVRGAKEIRAYLERCLRGGVVHGEELLEIRDTLRVGRKTKQYLQEFRESYSGLWDIVLPIESQKSLEDEISRCISEDGNVADNASPELAELRRSINRLQNRIRESLEGTLRNPVYQKMLQDPIITQRSDRYVIPIKQEYRGSFPGIVHDQSASGATLFIEPMPVVQLGNELREVILKEHREVQRILQMLSAQIEGRADEIADLHEALAQLDLVIAKAHLSLDMNAGSPELVTGQQLKLVQARHPLISGRVVPLSVELGIDFDTLVITGPNTGGKTVALKAVGLMAAMNQCGLQIPAESESKMGVFTQLFADIGDEQSVEQSLSTFSGHMKNIVDIINRADERSLVLLDEVGAGTDPTEGAALAMGILAELHERGCRTISTTHYGALKTFAYETPRVKNASVEFDTETLRPTYRLLIGIPGKSNAFTIAGRLGLSEGVLAKANTFVTEREMQVADLIENLGETRREIEIEKLKAETGRQAVEKQSKALEEKSNRLDEEVEILLALARDEASELVREAKREAEALIEELKSALKKENKQQQDIEKARQGFRKISAKLDQGRQIKRTGGELTADQIMLGQTVYMTKVKQKGQVVKLPNANGEVQVQAGIMKVMVPLTELKLAQEEKKAAPKRAREMGMGFRKAEEIRSEIDLRGMLVTEGTEALDKYMDDAVLGGIGMIYVIHGKGTGAMRAGIHDFLKGHPHVRSFRLGEYGEGDSGVTVVDLK
ncbi:MutS2 family protein [Desulfosporosinus orientis DSM 765]|uniref:Endonuclease MutS2 n=1 Tax=Desulfosporosinus orientis (strain ATCC 19365 / DSM 765 / NCIMB 8382 / VKM B-1628 / Singapore I) TaxID=768706 RepID=G7W513_DESOD|nr:endonuclease MutS2 [Desulfosporosinus orientis]AET65885.1 MutS2 family protein [Desulfosporosinus orientis DSM 765]